MNYFYEDFTEAEYRNLLRLARESWLFSGFGDYRATGRICLWRHDVDLSVHRAFRLAAIEAEEGVCSTYFLHIHNENYNFLEKEVKDLVHRITDLGHQLGLHFDPSFYCSTCRRLDTFLEHLIFEKELLEHFFDTSINVFSLHNPEQDHLQTFTQDDIAGMVNTYGNYFRNNYTYISDSNGYWRFRRLRDVLESAQGERLQVLTHPEWWTPIAMPPRERISRCIDGRALRQHERYDRAIAAFGRENVGKQRGDS